MKAVYSIIGFFVFVVFIIVAISLGSNASNNSTVEQVKSSVKLSDYSNTTSEAMVTITGPVTADEKHYSIRMKVNSGLRSIELIKGYQGTIEKTKTYQNNANAYDAFLKALDGAGYSGERSLDKDKQKNESGACPSGNTYGLDLTTPTNVVFHRWTTNCYGIRGTFSGDLSRVISLFQAQIPDYSEVTSGSSLY